jgi:hypothetical protein
VGSDGVHDLFAGHSSVGSRPRQPPPEVGRGGVGWSRLLRRCQLREGEWWGRSRGLDPGPPPHLPITS